MRYDDDGLEVGVSTLEMAIVTDWLRQQRSSAPVVERPYRSRWVVPDTLRELVESDG